jgi:hypothetical protein
VTRSTGAPYLDRSSKSGRRAPCSGGKVHDASQTMEKLSASLTCRSKNSFFWRFRSRGGNS